MMYDDYKKLQKVGKQSTIDTQIRGAKRGNPCKSRDNMTTEREPIL